MLRSKEYRNIVVIVIGNYHKFLYNTHAVMQSNPDDQSLRNDKMFDS